MSIHDKQELLILPKGVCMNPPRLHNNNCEGCKYLDGCTNVNKGKIKIKKDTKKG